MNDKTKKYLDKVIEFIVQDTRIDYEEKRIFFPTHLISTPSHLFFPYPSYFEKYCKEIYGLTMDEIHYVWTRYKIIMFNKIDEQ